VEERDFIRKFFLRANPNPSREGCPGPAVLRAIAENRLAPNDPARLHLADCSPCFAEFQEIKESLQQARRQRLYAVLAVAAGLIIAVVAGFGIQSYIESQRSATQMAAVNATVDLWNRGATRGGEPDIDGEMHLPKRLIKLKVILPRLSESGQYTVGIARATTDKNLIQASGVATTAGPKEIVTVTLDLRSTNPGVYFLTTTHEQDEASYYYPVKIN
jgi:hypothetical protein